MYPEVDRNLRRLSCIWDYSGLVSQKKIIGLSPFEANKQNAL